MATDRIRLPHVGALDGLRGAAVTGVVFFHGGYLTGGYLGVDLFFVLSGYLITSLLLAEWQSHGRVSLGAFWARRARRLLPAIVIVIAAVALYSLVFAARTELGRIRGDALATLGYVANWRAIFLDQSYFEILKSVPSPLDHTWSLAIEEQFYVFWPLIFVGLAVWWKKYLPQAVLVTALVLGTASTILMALLWDPSNVNRAYYGTDTRSFALFAGIAVAAAVHLWGHARGALRVVLEGAGIGALALLVFMWATVDGQTGRLYRGGFFAAGIAAAVLIVVAANPQRGPIGWALSFAPLRWLGLISYGLYLWHWPVDVVLDADRVGLTGWPLFVIRTAVALTIAIASYYLVEMPIRRGALRPTQWRVAIPAVAAVLVVATVTTTLGATTAQAISNVAYAPRRGDDVLLLGDSVAQSLAPGLDKYTKRFGLVWAAGCRLLHGTLPFQNAYSSDCAWEGAWQRVVGATRPRKAMALIGVWDLFDIQLRGSDHYVGPGNPEWNAAYRAQLEHLVTILGHNGAQPVLTTIPCVATVNVGAAQVFRRGAFDINRVKTANVIIRQVAAERHVQLVDLFSKLCPGDRYATYVDGIVTRSDGTHLSSDGADFVARWLVPQLGLPRGHTVTPATTAPPRSSNAARTGATTASTVARPPGS
jgi:peptidoglycan/LPS O-acetylase OafA/YrhL